MNIYQLPKLPIPEELTTILAESKTTRTTKIERIISTGQTSDWYDQSQTEFVLLLEGSAEIEFDNKPPATLQKGDYLIILPHERHRVSYTSTTPPCIWLCVFYAD